MFPVLLAAAEATEAAHAAGATNMLEQFGIEPVYLVMQIISFGILAGVLYKFMIKPVIATTDARTQKIESGLKYAEEMKAKLAATQQETAAILKQASLDAGRIVDDARKSAKDFVEKQTHEAAAKAAEILAKGQQNIELEHKKMLADARTEIVRLVIKTTEQVLAKKLSEADRAAYNESAARELAGV